MVTFATPNEAALRIPEVCLSVVARTTGNVGTVAVGRPYVGQKKEEGQEKLNYGKKPGVRFMCVISTHTLRLPVSWCVHADMIIDRVPRAR